MPLALASPLAFLHVATVQAAVLQDTIVARMVPQRDLFDWTSGVLQIVVLVLAIAMLGTLIVLLLSLRNAVLRVNGAIERLGNETRPLVDKATLIVEDAREVVAMVRTDVQRLTDATGVVTTQLANAAETAGRRIDEVNAVLDVLQHEIEATAIGAVAAVKGVATGTAEMGRALRGKPLRHAGLESDEMDAIDDEAYDESYDDLDDEFDELDEELDELEDGFDTLEEEVVHALDGDAPDEIAPDERAPRATDVRATDGRHPA